MIGVFDSGIGGLTVLKALREKLPEHSFIYFGDTARTPYGNKSAETVARYGREDAALLMRAGAKIIVIACNTVSALAADNLGKELPIPVFEVIKPAVNEAISKTKTGKIAVIGTRATIRSGAYQNLLSLSRGDICVRALACPLFVPLVEEGWEGGAEAGGIVRATLSELQFEGVDTLILGCTHYPLLKEQIRAVVPKEVRLIDSGEAVANEVAEFLAKNQEINATIPRGGSVRILVSDSTPHLAALVSTWLGDVKIEKATL